MSVDKTVALLIGASAAALEAADIYIRSLNKGVCPSIIVVAALDMAKTAAIHGVYDLVKEDV